MKKLNLNENTLTAFLPRPLARPLGRPRALPRARPLILFPPSSSITVINQSKIHCQHGARILPGDYERRLITANVLHWSLRLG